MQELQAKVLEIWDRHEAMSRASLRKEFVEILEEYLPKTGT